VPYADLTDPQTLNLYAYVRNNPLSRRDADGHCTGFCFDVWSWAVNRMVATSPSQFAKDVGIGAVKAVGSTAYNTLMTSNPPLMMLNQALGQPSALQPSNETQAVAKVATDVAVVVASAAAGAAGAAADATEAANGARLLEAANGARNALAGQVGKKIATVTAGYNTETGAVAAAGCGGGVCAEDNVVTALGGDASKVRFTTAVRPRTGAEVPVCTSCEAKYGRDVFPPGTKFQSDQIKQQ